MVHRGCSYIRNQNLFSMVPKILDLQPYEWDDDHTNHWLNVLNVLNVCRKQLAGSTCCVHFVSSGTIPCLHGYPQVQTWLKPFHVWRHTSKTIQSICQHSGFPKIGVPYFNHPFTDGFSPNKNHPMLAWGIPISMETPMNGGCIWTLAPKRHEPRSPGDGSGTDPGHPRDSASTAARGG